MIELRQHAEYTYKFNAKSGRHGWLRLTPAYSRRIVESLILGRPQGTRVFDPFCGTGTTALCASSHGYECVTIDINPFLVWLATVKTASYSPEDIAATAEACKQALALVAQSAVEPCPAPPIWNITRWWNEDARIFLQFLRAAIDAVAPKESPVRSLLLVAFCRTLMMVSNAAFDHQSMSFKDSGRLRPELEAHYGSMFEANVSFVLEGAKENPAGSVSVVLGDSRHLGNVARGSFDIVITSPPYANRMSYVRELRPYMYWLNYLDNGHDAGELDWLAIGGTWGIATSRLMDWERPSEHFQSTLLDGVLDTIAHTDNRNGALLARYVAKYFDDVWAHLSGLPPLLARGAEVHYIVGNSTFYGTMVPTEKLYAEMFRVLGFTAIECKPIRKRNSKKELIEFDVSARWT
ncbi:MAG: modification methylase, putative [Chloroflexus sp.]|uniref:DNA adenine methylase n=1 Tax=Chloroflexus sp. TaxID=1904827 RepID=UPI0021DD4625|nr:DNA adenine methylase [Chloroflexus sp.]GIV90279.1 MAG: modification methylase, putative [Chloroflexus sp.]